MRYLILLLVVFWGLLAIRADEGSLENLPAQEFLRVVRQPMQKDTWGEFAGTMTYKSKEKKMSSELWVRISFVKESLYAQITQDKTNVYTLEHYHPGDKNVTCRIDRPDAKEEKQPGLFAFGISPEDLAFTFFYWEFQEELPRKENLMQECRRMRLAIPDGSGSVVIWFHAKYGFPMRVEWFKNMEEKSWRSLMFKGVKRHANGLWFAREMLVQGQDWKTRVVFEAVEKNILEY